MIKAFILAAGLGTRLRPLTDRFPKAMAPIAPGLPLLEHHLRQLKVQGIHDFIINLHHRPDAIRDHFGDGSALGVCIEYSDETTGLLDTAGALRKAAPLLTDDFLLIYGDQLHFFDFAPLVSLYRKRRALAALVVKRSDLAQNGDLAEIDAETGRILRWHARPHRFTEFDASMYLNAGLYVLSSTIIDHIPKERPVSLDREILPALVSAHQPLYAYPSRDDILDIGTPEKYAAARKWFSAHPTAKRRALFLDRDGVILRALPRGTYLTDWQQSSLLEGIKPLIRSARAAGYLTVVVTNQPQVSRGLLSEAELQAIHDRMIVALDGQVDAVYYCPHTDEADCECRKPKAGMLLRGSHDLNIDLHRSIMVGDSYRDVRAGATAGCRTVFIRNEYNEAEAGLCVPELMVSTLSEIEPLL